MATAGEMIRLTAEALQVPEATVTSFHRMLREAGLLTKGGRGRSAPEMSARDVSRLLLAMLGADALVEAVEVTDLLRGLGSPTPMDLRAEYGQTTWDGEDGPILIDPAESSYDPADEPLHLEEAVARLLFQVRGIASGVEPKGEYLPIIGIVKSGDVTLNVMPTSLTASIVAGSVKLDFQLAGPSIGITYPDDWMDLPIRERLLARAEIDGVEITRSVGWASLARLAAALPSL